MKIILKEDWDIQISPPLNEEKIRGYYGGRNKEVEILANEILRGKKGSILISGYRGVGKTSLVYKSLWDLKEKDEDGNVILILINAAQLDMDVGSTSKSKEVNPRRIIENLIRRLYSTTHKDINLDPQIQNQIDSLYRRAIASDFRKIEGAHYQTDVSKETINETDIEHIFNEKNLIFISSWTLATILQVMPVTPYEWINKIAPLLLAFPVPFGVSILHRNYLKSIHSESEKHNMEELYEFDNNLGNLEFDLEKLHRNIANSNKKIIYVIDELDKLKEGQVEEILDYFKNFFALSDAIFIFICGEELFNLESKQSEKGIYRNKNYTYFTSKYFIPRPLWPDLKGFIDSIIYETLGEETGQIETLERALCFDSKNDFYDIKKFIKDRITSFDDQNRPIIELTLSDEDTKKARFHKVMTILFEEKYRLEGHSRWRENENLIRDLFIHANEIYSSYEGYAIEDPVGDDSKSEIVRDFNAFLYRLQAFMLERQKQVDIDQLNKKRSVSIYRYNGSIPDEPTSFLEGATEFEKRFINNFIEYIKYCLSPINALRKVRGKQELEENDLFSLSNDSKHEIIKGLGDDYLNIVNRHYNDFKILVDQPNRYQRSRNDTEKDIKSLEGQTAAFKRVLPHRIKNMLKYLYSDPNAEFKPLKDNKMNFSFLSDLQRSDLRNCHVLAKNDLSKQLIFIEDVAYLDQITEEIESMSSTHRVIFLTENASEATELKAVHVILTESPEALKESLIELLDELKTFWSNNNQNIAET